MHVAWEGSIDARPRASQPSMTSPDSALSRELSASSKQPRSRRSLSTTRLLATAP